MCETSVSGYPASQDLDNEMKTPVRRPAPADIVKAVVERLVCEGVDLKTVTLDEFKQRLQQTIRLMTKYPIHPTTAAV